MKILRLVFSFLVLQSVTLYADSIAIDIGALIPLTGQYAVVGEENRRGIELALNEYLGQDKLTIHYGDSKTEPLTAINEFKKISAANSAKAFYVQRSPIGLAVNSISKLNKIPLLGEVAHPKFTELNPYAWMFWSSTNDEGGFLAKGIIDNKHTKVAIITTEDEWTVALSEDFKKSFKGMGGQVVFDEPLLPTEMDLRTLFFKLKNKNPDAIFVNLSLNQMAPAFKQIRALQINQPIYSNFWCQSKDVIKASEKAIEGVRFAEMKSDYQEFTKAYRFKYKADPNSPTLSSYTATAFLIQVIKKNPNIKTSSDLQDAMLQEKFIELKDLTLEIKDRRVEYPLVLKQISNGLVVQ